jgi:hypothetical protein
MRYFILLFCFTSFGQTITYNGNLSESGSPLPGASICVKNTLKCTTSDFDGNYTIEVKLGDELVISYIGLKTKYIKVDSSLFSNIDTNEVKPILSKDFINKVTSNDTLTVDLPIGISNELIKKNYFFDHIVKIDKDKSKEYKFFTTDDYFRLSIEVYNSVIVGEPIKKYRFQNKYAQGRNIDSQLTYQSPETNEVFSWGPLISQLEHSNNPTVFYPNGDIINTVGSGRNVSIRNPNNFFRKAIDNLTTISTKIIMPKDDYLKFDMTYRNSLGVIETSQNDEFNTDVTFFKRINKHDLKLNFNYNRFQNNLSNSNFIYNKIIFANAITPVHFNNKIATQLPDGFPRSYSAFENNPFYLIQFNRDQNSSNLISFHISDVYKNKNVKNNFRLISQISDIKNTFGNVPFAAQITNPSFTIRDEQYYLISLMNDFKYSFNDDNLLGVNLGVKNQKRNLKRIDRVGFESLIFYPNSPQNETLLDKTQNRFEMNLNLNGEFNLFDILDYNDNIKLRASSDFLYSSTYNSGILFNFLAGFDWRFWLNRVGQITFYSNWNYFQFEPDLQVNNLNFNSLSYRLDDFKQTQNTNELFVPDKTVSPITESNFAYGFNFNSPVIVGFEIYHKNVYNLLAPVFQDNSYSWIPVVDYFQRGLEFSLQYSKYRYYPHESKIKYTAGLNFTTYRNRVTKIGLPLDRIPIAGFADINKNYMVNQPLGVIVGSAYERDSNNNILIDDSGFPIVSNQPKVLGDPNPDFIIGFTNKFEYKKLALNLNFDWSQGGELWNGTQQTLNYYGVSLLTQNQRNITDFIFNGVTQSGTLNMQPVSFYDLSQPLEQNRWVRYGKGGVAEEAIEDASFFRLNNVTLSYSDELKMNRQIVSLTFSFFINNAFILTKNKNAFAANAMFNSVETSSLDYFNSPILRSYGFSVAIKI